MEYGKLTAYGLIHPFFFIIKKKKGGWLSLKGSAAVGSFWVTFVSFFLSEKEENTKEEDPEGRDNIC